jgi:purine-binding chemotaxis protein CheW
MNSSVEPKNDPSVRKGGKYLTFALGKEEYGLEILKVREIIGYMDVTVVPRTPPHVKGVINLRGQVISVVDLRAKFGMQEASRTEQTCIVVVDINRDGRRVNIGVIVDRVSEVLNIAEDNTEDAPAFGAGIDTSFIRGMGKVGSSVKILLDIDRVLNAEEDAVSIDPEAVGPESAEASV